MILEFDHRIVINRVELAAGWAAHEYRRRGISAGIIQFPQCGCVSCPGTALDIAGSYIPDQIDSIFIKPKDRSLAPIHTMICP